MPDAPLPISIVLLSFNSEDSIGRTILSLQGLSDDIHVVDSFSKDGTVALCQSLGCQVVEHPFEGYSKQRNWSIDTLPLKYQWQLHVDADEEFTPELVDAIRALNLESSPVDGYILGRKIVFLGKVLRFGGIAQTWHYRLFRTGFGRCEDRLYDQHFVANGATERINAFMLDHQEANLSEWTTRHNRWSDLEAEEALQESMSGQIIAKATGNAIERKRYQKGFYYRMPLFWRALAYTFFRYFILLGFLDGTRGFIYHMLQGFWFRVLVDAKIYERRYFETRESEAVKTQLKTTS